MATIDLDALRRLGILPMNPGDTDAAIPEFPVINMGQEFGPNMEAELTMPKYFPQQGQAGVADATSSTGGQPAAPVEPPVNPTGRNFTLPFQGREYSPTDNVQSERPLGGTNLQLGDLGGGVERAISPEGMAVFRRANPADTQAWAARKQAEQQAQQQQGVSIAARGALEASRQKTAQEALKARLMQGLSGADPIHALPLLQQFQQGENQQRIMESLTQGGGAPDLNKPGIQTDIIRKYLGLPAQSGTTVNLLNPSLAADREKAVQDATAPGKVKLAGDIAEVTQPIRTRAIIDRTKDRAEVARNQPLGERAPKWLHPETGLPAAATLTENEALQQGYVPVTTQGMTGAATAKAALIQMQEYEDLAPKLLTKQSGSTLMDILGVQGNRARLGALRLAGDPDAKRLEGMFGAIATLARATGDTANIAVAEREFLKNFTLTESDTLESAQAKINQAKRILRGVVESRGLPVGQVGGAPQGPPARIEGTRIEDGEEQFFINGRWHRKKR